MRKSFLIMSVLLIACDSFACTSAIVSGRYTADGRPLMWKHRDTRNENNKLLYFTGGAYEFIGLVSAGKQENTDAWAGMNEAGFSIMNTASYNLNDTSEHVQGESDGRFMAQALAVCATLQDFENLLDSIKKPSGLESNFGVIDGQGGAAYYEVGNNSWVKIDVNDPATAPLGFVVRTNYSFSGQAERGKGYARYITAYDLFYRNAMLGNLNVSFIMREADRSLCNSFTRDDLRDFATNNNEVRLVHFNDNIARKISTSSVVLRGLREGDDPASTTMWILLGWPLTTVAHPVWLNDDHLLPDILTAPQDKNAPLCDLSLELKKECFPAVYGNGMEYLDINKVYNKNGKGYLQWLLPLEEEIFNISQQAMLMWDGKEPSGRQADKLYKEISDIIVSCARTHEPLLTEKYLNNK